jgi:hypothetical protein
MKSQKVTETTTTGPGGSSTKITKGAWKDAFSRAVAALKSAPSQDLNSLQVQALRKAAKAGTAKENKKRKMMVSKSGIVTTVTTKTPK